MAVVTTNSGLKYKDLVKDERTDAIADKSVSLHFARWLTDGWKLNYSHDLLIRSRSSRVASWASKGCDEDVQPIKVRGERKLTMLPQSGYGEPGLGGVIPPNEMQVFEVALPESLCFVETS